MLQSFRSRLVISNLLLALLGLGLVSLVCLQLLIGRSTQVKRQLRAGQAVNVATQVDSLFRRHASSGQLKQQIDLAAHVLGVRILVRSGRNGVVQVDSKNVFQGIPRPLDRNAYNTGSAATRKLFTNSNLVFFQAPLRSSVHENQVIGAIVLVARVQDVQLGRSELLSLLALVIGSALLVWLLIGLYFAASISRPLVRITRATERVAAGDYSVRVPLSGSSEISRLADSFNDMAEKVQNTNRLLRDFVANVSHDLRTPLTMIAGFSEAMLDGTADPAEIETTAGIINEEAVKMQRLVDNLLQLTRLESGLLKLQREQVDLGPFVGSLLHRAERMQGDGKRRFVNAVPASLPPVSVDPTQFERALRNLVDNAVQYTPSGGIITVGASLLTSSMVEVTVSDTGGGIAPDELARVFERFYRSDRSRERVLGHAGLGLAIVQEVVAGHGGTVRVESMLGSGTTFRLTVPRAAPEKESGTMTGMEARRAVTR
jgi:signal transduction histidine kinase